MPVPNPRNDPENAPNLQKPDSNQKVSASQDPKKCSGSQGNDLNSASQNTPTHNIAAMGVSADENLSEVSPEVSKSVSLKRFKFSPGMVKLHWKIHCSSA